HQDIRSHDALVFLKLVRSEFRDRSTVTQPAATAGKSAGCIRSGAPPDCFIIPPSFPRRRESIERSSRPRRLDPRLRGDDGRKARLQLPPAHAPKSAAGGKTPAAGVTCAPAGSSDCQKPRHLRRSIAGGESHF